MAKSKQTRDKTQKEPKATNFKKKDFQKLKRLAFEYIVVQGKSLEETSDLVGVSKISLSRWGNEVEPTWTDQRKARQQCYTTDAENTRKIITLLSENRLEIELKIREAIRLGNKEEELGLREQARGISDDISKHNKTLQTLDKENRITLGVYIDVMEDIFDSLRAYDEDLFIKCVDFQAQHIRKKMVELG